MAKTVASLQAFPSSLLPHTWSRALIPFPFPFERLPRRLERGEDLYYKYMQKMKSRDHPLFKLLPRSVSGTCNYKLKKTFREISSF